MKIYLGTAQFDLNYGITGLDEIPLSKNMSIVIDSKSKIKESIDNALDKILRKFYHNQIKKNISQEIINPANEVTRVILGRD